MEIIKKLNDKKNNLQYKIKKAKEEISKIDIAIKAFQEVCDHNYIADGRDSHHSYVVCTICGKEEKDIIPTDERTN